LPFANYFKNLQQELLLILYLALRYREALNKIARQSNICPFLDIQFNKTFGFTRKLVRSKSLAFLISEEE